GTDDARSRTDRDRERRTDVASHDPSRRSRRRDGPLPRLHDPRRPDLRLRLPPLPLRPLRSNRPQIVKLVFGGHTWKINLTGAKPPALSWFSGVTPGKST